MTEQINLTIPIVKPNITYWKVSRLELDWGRATIEIHLTFNPTGEEFITGYTNTEATNLMTIMNKKNFSTTSIHKTLLQKLINDGKLLGTISGTPD